MMMAHAESPRARAEHCVGTGASGKWESDCSRAVRSDAVGSSGRDDGGMIALGTFRPHANGSADLLLPLPVDAGGFDFVDISAEAGDGDPGHSARSVVRGPIRHL